MENKVEELLNSLGETPSQVANSLKERNCTGIKSSLCSCPIANLIKKEVGTVFVFGNYLSFGKYAVDIPKPVFEFICAFDQGKFPELIEKK